MRKHIIIGLVGLLVIVSVVVITKGLGDKQKDVALRILADKADLYVRNFHYTEVGDPDATWEVDADSAKYMKKENMAYLRNVRIKLTTSDGTVYYLSGKEGRLHTDNRNIDISGDVEILSENGDRLTTDCLNYSYARKIVSTESRVTMQTTATEITGRGLALSLVNNQLTLFSDIRALLNEIRMLP